VLAAAATVVGVAVALALIYRPSHVNYDAQYALLWARDAWQGFTPEYTADFAPTPHPLATAVSSLALPFGNEADLVILSLTLLIFGGLVWITYRLGAELFSAPVGVVAALVVATRPAMERDALLAYQDIPFALLIVAAVLLEARRSRRGVPVLVLLAVAGLIRPEAWALAGLYWLYLWPAQSPKRRAATAALVAAAPLIWSLTDLIVTGDALHSLHGTAELAEANDRRRSPEQVPYWTAQYFGFALREPLVLGVPIGLLFAWLYARRRSALPVATVVAMTLVFAIGPFFGLPLIRRYVETPAVLLTVFYGLAVCGWLLLPPGRARRRWQAAGLLAAALSIAYLPWHARELRRIEQRVDVTRAVYADLQRAAEAPAVRAAFANCAPLHAGDHRPVPFVRFWLDGEPGTVRARGPVGRMLLLPRRGSGIYNPETFPDVTPPPSLEPIYRNRSWRVYAAPGCVTRPPS
jgi:4-amino-4-deoxy-L-arabinose transferase-like glycosyltransferase